MLDPAQTHERCGFVTAAGEVVETPNVHPDPATGFDVPAESILAYADDAYGTWHTHPGESSNLSTSDWHYMLNFPTLRHFIVGTDSVAEYRIERGAVVHVR